MPFKLKCLSHTPLRGYNDPDIDTVLEVDSVLARARAEIEDFAPELIVIFAPDHYNGLFYDLMPQFVITTAAESVGDYKTRSGPILVPSELALELAQHILDSDLDIAISHRLQVDHGCAQTLEELTGSLTRYPVIPIVINCVAPPLGPYRRIRKLGESVGRFLSTLNKRVLILGSGGLSHEPPVPLLKGATDDVANFLIAGRKPTQEFRAARQARTIAAGKIYGTPACNLTPLNPEWDREFIKQMIEGRWAEVDQFNIEEMSKVAGRSVHEIRTWVAAFATLQAAAGGYVAREDFYRPINEWIAGYAVVSAD